MKTPPEILAYPRDATTMSARRGRPKFHACVDTDREVSACHGQLLVMESGIPINDLPESSLCGKTGCQRIFRQQARGRKTGKLDRRELPVGADRRAQPRRRRDKLEGRLGRTLVDAGFNECLVVVGYASRQNPFMLLGRVSADTGETSMPDPPLTQAEMQPVAFAAKMALAKVLSARKVRR